MNQTVLVTGGTGYVGSHAVVELITAGYEVFVIDNLYNSKASVLERIGRITGRRPEFMQIDVRDRAALRILFSRHRFHAVLHFAGLKAVGESVAKPAVYYDSNVSGSVGLLECMAEVGVRTMVFSSSAAVYGKAASMPIREGCPLLPTSPYGRSKLMVEEILRDVAAADPAWRVAVLRYFNSVGAHSSGLIGEDPNGEPNNLVPRIAQVAARKLKELPVFGADYPTPDGTGVRDYTHVVDIARAHVAALSALRERTGVLTVNLGTGRGHSVFEIVRAFKHASGRAVPCRVVKRRAGDVAQCYADPALAREVLGWQARLDVDAVCADTWRWQRWAEEHLR